MMGVSTEAFTFYGVKLDYDDAFSEAFDSHYQDLEDYVIIDGMSGEYMVIGSMLFRSGDARWDAMQGFGVFDVDDLPNQKAEVVAKIAVHMPKWVHLLDGEWKLMTFIHYS